MIYIFSFDADVQSLVRMASFHETEGDMVSAERKYALALKTDPLNYEGTILSI